MAPNGPPGSLNEFGQPIGGLPGGGGGLLPNIGTEQGPGYAPVPGVAPPGTIIPMPGVSEPGQQYRIGDTAQDENGWTYAVVGLYDDGTPRWAPYSGEQQRFALEGGFGGAGGAGATWRPGEYDLMLQQLQESIRQFNEDQAEKQKSRSLTSARDSLSAYLEASALSDARRLKAFQETRALLPQVVPRNMQYAPGFEPTGPLAGMAQGLGADFTPFEMQHVPVDPSQMAQPAPINPEVMKAMQAMEALGAA